MYRVLRSFLFLFDPEQVHHFSMHGLKLLCRIPLLKSLIRWYFKPENKDYNALNLLFKNRIGLGAGFDKNAMYLSELEALGFGFVEIGTVTPLAQNGNEKPRLFRLPLDKALINRMGFNNEGAEVVSKRLKIWRSQNNSNLIIGGNIGKNKATSNDDAWKDYEICFLSLHDHVDYFVVNVSSPNTPGLRALQDKDSLSRILVNLQQLNSQSKFPKPILLKIAPDLNKQQVDDVIELATEINLDGLIVSNTTIDRSDLETDLNTVKEIGPGGLSGLPLRQRSTELIRYISKKTDNKLFIIGSGGIFADKDAKEKLEAGASLIQVWTGFVYEGPAIVKRISKGLN